MSLIPRNSLFILKFFFNNEKAGQLSGVLR